MLIEFLSWVILCCFLGDELVVSQCLDLKNKVLNEWRYWEINAHWRNNFITKKKKKKTNMTKTKQSSLNVYSQISYKGHSQKFWNLMFFASICSFPPRSSFPQRKLRTNYSLENKSHFMHLKSLINKTHLNTVVYRAMPMHIIIHNL